MENPNHAFPTNDPHMHESPHGEWVKWEDIQEAMRVLFEAKNSNEWVSAVVGLRNLGEE